MMQVRPMRMPMRHRIMLVPVAMDSRTGLRMPVPVMVVIVTMAVLVFLRFVGMFVLMPVVEYKIESAGQNRSGDELNNGNRFTQQNDRKNDSKERAGGKEHLPARRPYILGGGDIQHDTCPITNCADTKSGKCCR